MATRNTRASPRGNSGTSFPQSFCSQYPEPPSEVADVWEVVEDVDVVGSGDGWVLPPALEVISSVEEETVESEPAEEELLLVTELVCVCVDC